MENNLFRDFILIEAGIEVDYTPKIHKKYPSIDYHAIYIQEDGM